MISGLLFITMSATVALGLYTVADNLFSFIQMKKCDKFIEEQLKKKRDKQLNSSPDYDNSISDNIDVTQDEKCYQIYKADDGFYKIRRIEYNVNDCDTDFIYRIRYTKDQAKSVASELNSILIVELFKLTKSLDDKMDI